MYKYPIWLKFYVFLSTTFVLVGCILFIIYIKNYTLMDFELEVYTSRAARAEALKAFHKNGAYYLIDAKIKKDSVGQSNDLSNSFKTYQVNSSNDAFYIVEFNKEMTRLSKDLSSTPEPAPNK